MNSKLQLCSNWKYRIGPSLKYILLYVNIIPKIIYYWKMSNLRDSCIVFYFLFYKLPFSDKWSSPFPYSAMSIRHFLIDRPTKVLSQFQHLKIKKETGNSVSFSPMPGNHSLNSELLRTLNQNSQRPTTQRSNRTEGDAAHQRTIRETLLLFWNLALFNPWRTSYSASKIKIES